MTRYAYKATCNPQYSTKNQTRSISNPKHKLLIQREDTMPVTELALLRLRLQDPPSPTKSTFLEAKKKQSEYSGYPVTYLRQIEDPLSLYLLGGWESVEKHTGEGQWLSLEVNQNLLAKLKDNVDVCWMFHLDIDVSFLILTKS